MNWLDWVMGLVGQVVLVYRTALLLNVRAGAKEMTQLGVKWLLFMIFIEFEPLLHELFGWLPLGGLLVRGIKLLLILPQNSTTVYLLEKVQSYMESISHEEIESSLASRISQAAKQVSLWLLRMLERIAPLVRSSQLQAIEEEMQTLRDKLVKKRREVTFRKSMRQKPSE